jgi:putative nucleotidyltransferase with HDIG domain
MWLFEEAMRPAQIVSLIRPSSLTGRTFLFITLAMGLMLGAAFAGGMIVAPKGFSATMSAGGMMLAVAVAAAASRSITRPFNRLMDTLGQSERDGLRAPRFSADLGVHELNHLAEALNGAAQSLRQSQADLERAYVQFVETMAEALDARDPYTAGHSVRVGAYAYAIAQEMGLPQDQAETIRVAGQLHDIGKIGVSDVLLQKPGRLTSEEFGLIKLHPQIGRKILEKVGRFEKLLAPIELHHENYDGSGYPYGRAGDRIPIEARILHVADCFDAMNTNRAYRMALPLQGAIEELRANSGTQFDPAVVAVFMKMIVDGKQDDILMAADSRLLAAGPVMELEMVSY